MIKCGFYERCITPPLGSNMMGYFIPRPCEGVKDELYVKAVVFSDGKNVSAIASIDILSLPKDNFIDKVLDRVEKLSQKIKRESVILTATHSHTSGPVDPDGGLDSLYIDMLSINVADTILIAEQRMENMTVKYAKPNAEDIAFIRNFRLSDGTICTNPGYDADISERYGSNEPCVPTLYFYDESGRIRGAVTNFALHHDTIGGRLCSPDYSGALATELKKHYGEDFVCVFLNGPCGNIGAVDWMNGPKKFDVPNFARIGKKLAGEIIAAEPVSCKIDGGTVLSSRKIINLKRRKIPAEYLDEARDFVKRGVTVDDFDPGLPKSKEFRIATAASIVNRYGDNKESEDIPVTVLRVGDCVIYGIPFEVYSDYGEELKSKSPTDKVFITELSGSSSEAYLPSMDLIDIDTVYETNFTSRTMEPEAGNKIVAASLELANNLF